MCFRIWLTRLDLRQGAILVSLRVEVWTPEHPKEFLVWLLAQSLAFTVDALPHGLVLRKWGWNSLVSFSHAHTYILEYPVEIAKLFSKMLCILDLFGSIVGIPLGLLPDRSRKNPFRRGRIKHLQSRVGRACTDTP